MTVNRINKRGRGRVTRRDVARAAGVSLTTVTHALNNTDGARVSEGTRERVRSVARQLGYKSSFAGTALALGRTRTIGLLQPDPGTMESHIYQQIIHGMARAMEEAGYHLLLLFRTPRQHYRDLIIQGRIDGVFILQSDQDTRDIVTLAETGIPTVVVNKHYSDESYKNLSCVHSDHAEAGYDIIMEMAGAGCRRMLTCHDNRVCDANIQLQLGFDRAADELLKLGVMVTGILPDEKRLKLQLEAAGSGKGSPWDGIYVVNPAGIDIVAKTLNENGANFSDVYFTATCPFPHVFSNARLERSVYHQDLLAVGQRAWEVMGKLLEGEEVSPVNKLPYNHCLVGKA